MLVHETDGYPPKGSINFIAFSCGAKGLPPRVISQSSHKFQAAHRAGDFKLPGHPVSKRIVTQ